MYHLPSKGLPIRTETTGSCKSLLLARSAVYCTPGQMTANADERLQNPCLMILLATFNIREHSVHLVCTVEQYSYLAGIYSASVKSDTRETDRVTTPLLIVSLRRFLICLYMTSSLIGLPNPCKWGRLNKNADQSILVKQGLPLR